MLGVTTLEKPPEEWLVICRGSAVESKQESVLDLRWDLNNAFSCVVLTKLLNLPHPQVFHLHNIDCNNSVREYYYEDYIRQCIART